MVFYSINTIFRKWYYYFLTESGVNYLREYLHLPADVVPDTQKVTPAVYKYILLKVHIINSIIVLLN